MALYGHPQPAFAGPALGKSAIREPRRALALFLFVALASVAVTSTASATWIEERSNPTNAFDRLDSLAGNLTEELVLDSSKAKPVRVLPGGSVLRRELTEWQHRSSGTTNLRIPVLKTR